MSTTNQFCTFYIDGHFFGTEVEKVQEVIRYQDMTRVPLAPPSVSGLINLRGQIVTAIDTRERLGFPARPCEVKPMNVVIRSDHGAVSLLVDEIGDVIEVDSQSYENAPDNISGKARELIKGVYKLKGHLLLILNTDRALAIERVGSEA